ncbi:MAG: minor capsid protein [Candidatus Kapabacteria bacterium]|nr:minor capsid protein [Candidatus Kapabacteria bacterium]
MTMPFPDDLLSAINQPPEKAVAFLNKKFPTLKANYDELDKEARARAFTIARITELDVLQTTLTGLEVAMNSGTGYKEFQKGLAEYLTKAGWYSSDNADSKEKLTPRRLELIYKTNTDQAIAAGRWQQLWDTRDSRPYLQYRIDQLGVSEKHRAEHELLNGKVFRIDDPVWDVIYPPRGFRCNCGVVSVSDAYIKRKGLTVEESGKNLVEDEDGTLSYRVKTADGRTVLITPPKGFERHIAQGLYQPNLDRYDYSLARRYVQQSIKGAAFQMFFNGEISGVVPVAVLNSDYRKALEATSQVVLFSSQTRDSHTKHKLTVSDYTNLQDVVENAEKVYAVDGQKLLFAKRDGKIYFAAVKTTKDKSENYLVSYFTTDEKYVTNNRKKATSIIRDEAWK